MALLSLSCRLLSAPRSTYCRVESGLHRRTGDRRPASRQAGLRPATATERAPQHARATNLKHLVPLHSFSSRLRPPDNPCTLYDYFTIFRVTAGKPPIDQKTCCRSGREAATWRRWNLHTAQRDLHFFDIIIRLPARDSASDNNTASIDFHGFFHISRERV